MGKRDGTRFWALLGVVALASSLATAGATAAYAAEASSGYVYASGNGKRYQGKARVNNSTQQAIGQVESNSGTVPIGYMGAYAILSVGGSVCASTGTQYNSVAALIKYTTAGGYCGASNLYRASTAISVYNGSGYNSSGAATTPYITF
jgi:hypothetical protein